MFDPTTATPDQIKARYDELASRYDNIMETGAVLSRMGNCLDSKADLKTLGVQLVQVTEQMNQLNLFLHVGPLSQLHYA